MCVIVRRAITLDAEDIFAIEKVTFSDPWSVQNIKNDIANPVACYWVATIEAKIVGYVGMWNVVGEGQLTNLAISKDFQRQGIASMLLRAVIEYAHKLDMEFIMLEVRASNEAAKFLYQKFNFQEIAVRTGYYTLPKEDALVMKYSLMA